MAQLKSVVPISDEDTDALPVKKIGPAVAFYEATLGFATTSQDEERATVIRDGIQLGLVRQPDHEPGRAGSVAIEVDELEAFHRELQTRGAHPGEFGTDQWDGRSYRTFFVREDENGYCYCFYSPA